MLLLLPLGSKAQLKSGYYYPGLALAVDPKSKEVSGFFETYRDFNPTTGEPTTFCRFFIKGRIAKDSIRIYTFHPNWHDTIKGWFFLAGDTMFNMKLRQEPPCWNGVEEENVVYKGMRFDYDRPKGWLAIGIVKSKRACLYAAESEKSKKTMELKQHDCVKVLARRKHWLKVEISKDEEVLGVGWMLAKDYF